MENWILAVNYDREKFVETQAEWLKYNVFICVVSTVQKAILELSRNKIYSLVVIFSSRDDYLSHLFVLRSLTRVPILIIKCKYDGSEKLAAIEAGADEYIEWPVSVMESVASGRALIRRYMTLNPPDDKKLNIFSAGEVFISLDFRKVFIKAVEIQFPRREFDLFYLLVSNPNRIFRPEQLYRKVWGTDYIPTENSLHSCIRRIRRKLERMAETTCQIHNQRGVGYYFSHNNT